MNILSLLVSFLLASCSFSIICNHSSGQSTEDVDEDQTPSSSLSIPITGI